MTDERSDAELLQAHVDGDGDAFGVLFRRHRDRLWAVALLTIMAHGADAVSIDHLLRRRNVENEASL